MEVYRIGTSPSHDWERRPRRPYQSTLLELVQIVQRQCRSEREVAKLITRLVNSGRVVLTGSFVGERI